MIELLEDILVQAAMASLDQMIAQMTAEGRFSGKGDPTLEEAIRLDVIHGFLESLMARNALREMN